MDRTELTTDEEINQLLAAMKEHEEWQMKEWFNTNFDMEG